jgi:hypothetical protein
LWQWVSQQNPNGQTLEEALAAARRPWPSMTPTTGTI